MKNICMIIHLLHLVSKHVNNLNKTETNDRTIQHILQTFGYAFLLKQIHFVTDKHELVVDL